MIRSERRALDYAVDRLSNVQRVGRRKEHAFDDSNRLASFGFPQDIIDDGVILLVTAVDAVKAAAKMFWVGCIALHVRSPLRAAKALICAYRSEIIPVSAQCAASDLMRP